MKTEGKSEEDESRNQRKKVFQEGVSGQMVPQSLVGHRWKVSIAERLERTEVRGPGTRQRAGRQGWACPHTRG